MPSRPYHGIPREERVRPKSQRRHVEQGKMELMSSDGVRLTARSSKLASRSTIFEAWIREGLDSIKFEDPILERADVLRSSIAIIDRDQSINDVPYQCQIDVIRFLTKYKFADELRYIRATVHSLLGRYANSLHPLTVFRIAVHLDDVDLCGRILAEMGSMTLSHAHWGLETFGEGLQGESALSAGAMSFQDMQSLPPAVYWALARAEMMCMSGDYGGIADEFMRLMRLQGSPARL